MTKSKSITGTTYNCNHRMETIQCVLPALLSERLEYVDTDLGDLIHELELNSYEASQALNIRELHNVS